MCGFAGEFVFHGRADRDLAGAMADRLRHRGPDEESSFLSADGRCAIGFHRLAVIDVVGSHQPMTEANDRATVAFNGEIYNFRYLREQLAAKGVTFRTDGDTEVLLHLYARDGVEMVEHIEGMFALAIYDVPAGTLLLARDRLGQKPLWYAPLPDRIVFASEAKGLLAHPLVPKAVSEKAVTAYMTIGYASAPHSIWDGVLKICPGHRMLVAGPDCAQQRYWEPRRRDLPGDGGELTERVRAELGRAVAEHMISDVPLGALLSGGVDSSIVVALMCRRSGGGANVRTFSAGFEDAAYDERPAARTVAEHLGTDHTELLVSPRPEGMLQSVVDMYDEPLADSSALPTWLICRAAQQRVTVALTGDGGDEVFGGYDRYRALHLAEGMGAVRYLAVRAAGAVARLVAGPWERSWLRRLIRFAEALPHPFAHQYFMYRRLFGPRELPRLFTDSFTESTDVEAPAEWFCELYESGDFDDEVAHAQRHDLLTYLPDDLLVKADIASMASSLELRAPMLDRRVVELGLSLPVGCKVDRRGGKRILREAFGEMLPREVFERRKRGFAVPLARWLREDLRDELTDTLLDQGFLGRGVFRREAIVGLINDHLSGRDDHCHRLWALLVLARWWASQG